MPNPEDIIDLIFHYERVNNKLKALQAKPQDSGMGETLAMPEVHLIKGAKYYPNDNISNLAERFAVTKGAVSQTVNKLVKRGYLRKYKYDDNKKEVYIQLTEKGQQAFDNIMASYDEIAKILLEFAGKDDHKLKTIHEFLDLVEKLLDEAAEQS